MTKNVAFTSSDSNMHLDFVDKLYQANLHAGSVPSTKKAINWADSLIALLFPDCCQNRFRTLTEVQTQMVRLQAELQKILEYIHDFQPYQIQSQRDKFFAVLPEIHEKLQQDIQAMYDGDPAAKSLHEVMLTYPGFYAIARHRIAHEFYKLNVPLLPRIISEHAHQKTGIDIHPGAQIGRSFCIDHGTGIVIGETCVIGDNVKIYQGVTLGALSVAKHLNGHKRHPTIENNVVIYANATILGGETIIGANSVIGGNVWLTKSIEPFSKVYHRAETIVK